MPNNDLARKTNQQRLQEIFEEETRYFLSEIYISERGSEYFNERISTGDDEEIYKTHISVSVYPLINRGFRWSKKQQRWLKHEKST